MMLRKLVITWLALVGLSAVHAIDQSTPYILTDFPISLVTQDTGVWIKWTGASRNPLDSNLVPDSGRIYFSKSPGGSVIANYPDSITKRCIDTVIIDKDTTYISQNNILFKGMPPQRGIKFRPSDNNMGAGIYYIMVAWRTKIGPLDTTFYSNEIQFIVESNSSVKLVAPANAAVIDNLTPTFQWEKNAGVPYYHIIVSDEKLNISSDSTNFTIEGLSIIWQAITSNTQMTYGAPDPSKTITADPPPLSPGKEYSWAVLNNYGNHPAYSSTRFSLPGSFAMQGLPLKTPKNVWIYPSDTLQSSQYPSITLKWTNLDTAANTYKVYIYVGSDFEGINAQMVLWSNEVTAKQFTGDTAFMTIDAKAILTSNYYTWKVIAIDNKGAGTAGKTSGFRYVSPTGVIRVKTRENIYAGADVIVKPVGLVEVKVEVLDGSLEAPLLFYTDNDGYLSRSRPAGTYRLTTVKDGFVSQSKTVTIKDGDTSLTEFYLKRPDATIYGKVLDGAGSPINLAKVTGVSERGDTASADTDPLGNFIISCYEADWSISAQKTGYISSLPVDTAVTFGKSISLSSAIVLKKNPYTLSGIVKNSGGSPLLGVNVKLLLEGTEIAEVPSTPQTGSFSFTVESGTYTLKATKVGFTSYTSEIQVLNSMQLTVTLNEGAALITGTIKGRSYNSTYQEIFAPITRATILVVDTAKNPDDTITTQSDAVYGNFSASVASLTGGKKYKIFANAAGYVTEPAGLSVTVEPGKTYPVSDTLKALAVIKGGVRMSDSGSVKVSDVSISLIDTATNTIVSTAKSDALGMFELRNIPDGLHYRIVSGKDGLITDSTTLTDTSGAVEFGTILMVNDGLPKLKTANTVISAVNITVKSGTKAIQWVLKHGAGAITDASIKLQSPVLKTVPATSVVGGVGPGAYMMSIDAGPDSLLDCSYHVFTIPFGADSLYTDTVLLPATHYKSDSITLTNDSVALTVYVADTALSSGFIYFRDINAQSCDSAAYVSYSNSGSVRLYRFKFRYTKDGSHLVYYFKLRMGNNVYGYSTETFKSYVRPDVNVLSKIGVSPGADDTLLFPADAAMEFYFNGYFGSKFSPATQLTKDNVTWSWVNAYGCKIVTQDKDVVIETPSGGTGANIAALRAVFNETPVYKLAAGVKDTVVTYFKVTPWKLDSIRVVRTDKDDRGYITSSSLDKAEFVGEGIDEQGSVVAVSPVWEIIPANAGTVEKGVFKPAKNFMGRAKIEASVGRIVNEFYDQSARKYGLAVYHIISPYRDTVTNNTGCRIILPPGLVTAGADAELSLEVPVLTNEIYFSSYIETKDSILMNGSLLNGKIDVLGTIYDITDRDSVIKAGTVLSDSITITLDIPEAFQNDAVRDPDRFFIATWYKAEEEWQPLDNSIVSDDGSSVSLRTTHFSRYAIMSRPAQANLKVTVKPNPFSPDVIPVLDHGIDAIKGTCIEISAVSQYDRTFKINMDIYNVVGDRVWSTVIINAVSGAYKVWWDGKTLDHTINLYNSTTDIGTGTKTFKVNGNRLCRNGRYFLVVVIKDSKKQKKEMKQIVLFK